MMLPTCTSSILNVFARYFSVLDFTIVFSKILPSKLTTLPSAWIVRARIPLIPVTAFEVGDLDIGILSALFRQNFDPDIVELRVRRPPRLFPVHLPVQVNRPCSRRLRLAGHFQFFWRYRQPVISRHIWPGWPVEHCPHQYEKEEKQHASWTHLSSPHEWNVRLDAGENSLATEASRKGDPRQSSLPSWALAFRPKFRKQGFCTSTGVVEAGCKVVIGTRLKRAGMHWTVKGANTIIALRCSKLSGRFEDFWERRSDQRKTAA
jgi:hypothetical protein